MQVDKTNPNNNVAVQNSTARDPAAVLPPEMVLEIFSNLDLGDLAACQQVCREWRPLAADPKLPGLNAIAQVRELKKEFPHFPIFGPEEWVKYYGRIDKNDIKPLSPEMIKIIKGVLPKCQGKKGHEVLKLTYFPKTVNGKPLTPNNFEELIQNPKEGHAAKYDYFWPAARQEHGDTPIERAHWTLSTKDVIEGSKGKTEDELLALAKSIGPGWGVPTALGAVVSTVSEYTATGVRRLGIDSFTFTLCQEQTSGMNLAVGGFAPSGLDVSNHFINDSLGVVSQRKF